MDVSVVVPFYGDDKWRDLAVERAAASALKQTDSVTVIGGRDLADARNNGLRLTSTERVIFLDADDELEPGYIDAMGDGTADLRVPRVRYVTERRSPKPIMPRVAGLQHQHHDCTGDCLAYGNWIVIGCCAPTQMLRDVGGFRDFIWSEDWDLWVRCWQAGATIETIETAVYRAHVRPDSRNRAPERAVKHAQHQAIARANGLPVPA